jgi:pimeloyl-ACP methyl ester carboxylesterase
MSRPTASARLLPALLAVLATTPARAFDLQAELRNYAKQHERFTYTEANPDYQLLLAFGSAPRFFDPIDSVLRDPSRRPLNLCATHQNACFGDARVADWGDRYGLSIAVTWINRNGATISGHVWAAFPKEGASGSLPGIVITTGDTQAPEEIYWWAAQVLAAHGYEVLTWDPQGHGESDTIGKGDNATRDVVLQQSSDFGDQAALDEEFATEIGEALDFLMSTANPLYPQLDTTKIGLAGHSRGAFATSIVGSRDERVGAIVGWDNLTAGGPNRLSPNDTLAPLVPRVPALGIASEYYVGDPPYSADPDPQGNNGAFLAHRSAGIDAMEVTIRGGTHFEYSFLPNPAFTATLRGIDLASWYTVAWFDKQLKHDPTADRRLLSNRWRDDAAGAEVDLAGDGNLFSIYYRSRLGFGRESAPYDVVTCDDLRSGCAALIPPSEDGGPTSYSFIDDRGL